MTSIAKAFSPTAAPEFATWWWSGGDSAAQCWQAWAVDAASWLAQVGVNARDAAIILPVGAVLAQARQAWAEAVGGWVPRIDTIAAVAASAAWDWCAAPEDPEAPWPLLTLDVITDRLHVARKLGEEPWARQWARRDRRGFEFALDHVVDAAHTWLRRLQAIAPAERASYGAAARSQLMGSPGAELGPGHRERLLLAWALECAAATAEAGLPTDALFAWRPLALMGVTAGESVSPGTEAHLMLGVMAHLGQLGVPVRRVVAQVGRAPLAASMPRPKLRPCADAEDEAQQAAAQVIEAVNQARRAGSSEAVALIALDRSLVRRVRAMLEGSGAQIADETGWRVSTTRAAAVISRLVQVSQPHASSDDLLDWLKSGWLTWQAEGCSLDEAVAQLELWCRRHGMLGAWSLQWPADDSGQALNMGAALPQQIPQGRQGMPESAAKLWCWADKVVAPVRAMWSGKRPSLWDWLQALQAALKACGSWDALEPDPAGELALQSLRLDEPGSGASQDAWLGLSKQTRLDGAAFQRWVSTVLEATTFRPAAPAGGGDVVITPLARAVLRPFHAVVVPGADERQLGALGKPSSWLSTKLCEAMDLPTPQSLREAQWEAFKLLMGRPGVICLYRRAQGSEPLEPSPWLERWSALAEVVIEAPADARVEVAVAGCPISPPRPSLQGQLWALPKAVTATSYESLRQCPYRFFATSVLGLREQDELDEGLDGSDFGIWLHEVLRVFHAARQDQLRPGTEDDDVQAWLVCAEQVVRQAGLDRDGQRPYFLPFQADLGKLALAYVGWLRSHEGKGWQVRDTEVVAQRHIEVDADVPLMLHGQLDRVDTRRHEGAPQQLVIDYKTGSLDKLKGRVASPLEDTQLAFYAALSEAGGPVAAAYVHLDARGVTQVDHDEVADSAQELIEGLMRDWSQLHAGAAMPALGEGAACVYCQARGLCRKDHWSSKEARP